jgi:hypothetical protein
MAERFGGTVWYVVPAICETCLNDAKCLWDGIKIWASPKDSKEIIAKKIADAIEEYNNSHKENHQ